MPETKRQFFTADARLSVKRTTRPIAGKFTKDSTGADVPAVESICTLTGYPIVWNVLSTDRGGFKVKLLPGSATFTDPAQAYWHHNPAVVLGNTANGTLRLTPDDIGVKVEIDLPDTTDGNNAETLVGQKYVTGMSFAMVNAPNGTSATEAGEEILSVTSFLSDEVTITGIPSFTQTSIGVADDEEDFDDDGYTAESTRLEQLKFALFTL
jgi:uncharacterized protein